MHIRSLVALELELEEKTFAIGFIPMTHYHVETTDRPVDEALREERERNVVTRASTKMDQSAHLCPRHDSVSIR